MSLPHQFQPGKPRHPDAGRRPGSPNKTTVLLKDALMQAATEAGEGNLVAYLRKMALEQPAAFLPLLGRVLPLQIEAEAKRTALVITEVRHIVIDNAAEAPEPPRLQPIVMKHKDIQA